MGGQQRLTAGRSAVQRVTGRRRRGNQRGNPRRGVRPGALGPPQGDSGSATPLMLGMVLCLLLLSVGVIAAGSVVLAKQNLQSACDAAASAVAGQLTPDQINGGRLTDLDDRLATELHRRRSGGDVTGAATELSVRARCQARSEVAFGGLFGNPTVGISVDAVGNLTRS
ncbi:pilus assembly protein TadG-related protein [Nakamurella aerolata]|uniref:Putative Flp pilus-assembly TadG-like N-terminal domain-containing protein n=1 Tax=Nakamurella aerolata TaxID=1656892 RepID=A0A849A963_9ACTN|nr:pilus assembly protein TadG-related protein [Nakamurella aerolata]NNG37085.1 hypothetical protein [Nakamurella aerolata]